MKKTKSVWVMALLLAAGAAFAIDGAFDRGAETAKYLKIMTDGTRTDVILASKNIYVSGLADAALGRAIADRLQRDYQGLKQGNRADTQHGIWMAKALASLGNQEHAALLQQVANGTKLTSLASEIRDELALLPWHRRKNELMASRQHHREGDNPRATQLLNLLKSDDFNHKHLAADRISWEKLLDVRVLDEMAAQLGQFAASGKDDDSRIETKTLGLYAKLLGYSGDAKYRDVLQQVMKSGGGTLVKKHAKEALSRLQ
jgi:hypothetical protein